MKAFSGVLALAAAAVLLASASRAEAQAAYSDKLCPEATQYVVALGKLTQTSTAQQVYDTAHATTGAYETCATRYLGNGQIEPQLHYAYTRQASYAIVEARALLALNRPADAKRVLQTSRRLAGEVFDWRSDSKLPANYHDAAKEIIDVADAMLAKLSAPAAAASPAPAPAASPHR